MRKLHYITRNPKLEVFPGLSILEDIASPPFFLTRHLQRMVVLLGCRLLAVLGWTHTGIGIILQTTTSKSSTENSRTVEPNATTLTENTGNFPRSSPKQTSPFILLARIASPHHTQAKHIVREMRGP